MAKPSLLKVFEKRAKGEISIPHFYVSTGLREWHLSSYDAPRGFDLVWLKVRFYFLNSEGFSAGDEQTLEFEPPFVGVLKARQAVERAEKTVDTRARKAGW